MNTDPERISKPWMPILIRQKDADPTGSGSGSTAKPDLSVKNLLGEKPTIPILSASPPLVMGRIRMSRRLKSFVSISSRIDAIITLLHSSINWKKTSIKQKTTLHNPRKLLLTIPAATSQYISHLCRLTGCICICNCFKISREIFLHAALKIIFTRTTF